MAISPIGVGDRSLLLCSLTTDSGVFSLVGVSTPQMVMHYIDTANATLHIGTGSWTITDAANGKATYAPSVADVATPGIYRLYPVLQLATGPKAFDPQVQEILNLP